MNHRDRHVILVYALTIIWLATWWWLGTNDRGASQYFQEGGPVDGLSSVFLASSCLLAWMAALAGRRRREPGSWFWAVSVLGFAWLVFDERFQVHERVGLYLKDAWIEPPFLRNWNDAIFLAYGLAAGLLLAAARRTLLRHRRTLVYLVVGGAAFVLHTAVDLVLATSVESKSLVEESFKVLAATSFMVAYLEGALELSGAVPAPSDEPPAPSPAGPGAGAIATVFGATLLLAVALMLAERQPGWYELVTKGWGDPVSWLLFASFGAAATLTALSRVGRRFASGSSVVFWAGSLVIWALLAVAELVPACIEAFMWCFYDSFYPVPIYLRVASLQDPVGLTIILVAVALIIVAGLGVRVLSSAGWRRFIPATAALLLLVLPLVRTIWPEADTANVLLRGALAGSAVTTAMVWFQGALAARRRRPHAVRGQRGWRPTQRLWR